MTYIDAILHIADYPALAAMIALKNPDDVSEDGQIISLSTTPLIRNADAALAYIRVSAEKLSEMGDWPSATILAEHPYGPKVVDQLYAALFANPDAKALYDAVYPRLAFALADGTTLSPPLRFAALG